MNERVKPPAEGEAEIIKMPNTTAEAPQQPAQQPQSAPAPAAPAAPAAAQPAEPAADAPKKKNGSRRLILMVAVPLVLVVGGGWFWLTGGRYEDTDNAYVTQPIVSISPDISGRITEIHAQENQVVKAGDVLFKLDPSSYQIALDQAKAQVGQANTAVDQANTAVAAARLNVAQLRVAYTTAKTKLVADQAALTIQQRTQGRNTDLASKGVATQTTVDEGQLAVQQAQQAVDLDQQSVQSAIAALDGNPDIATDDHPTVKTALAAVSTAQAAVKTAEAAVAAAELNLKKATVTAPADGIISQIGSFNVGQFVGAGTTIVSLVETDNTWVEANFKETQLEQIKVGQPAKVAVDAYGGPALTGTVESIGAATGAQFSLIPAQNATGNWVKVVQRVPVRIKVTPNDDQPLRSGMSAAVTVDTGRSTLDKLQGH
jgi:membrane fusion protein (multidrug efflux system)